jgi:hypothetical protein
MQKIVEELKKAITLLASSSGWEIPHFFYNAKNCSDSNDAGPGIEFNLKGYSYTWRLHYPIKNYLTIESFFDAFNCDTAIFNAFTKYSELHIFGSSLINNELIILHPDTKDKEVLPLNKIYQQATGVIDSVMLQQLARQAWKNIATRRNYAYRGIPTILATIKIPGKILPPFFFKAEDLQQLLQLAEVNI